LAAGIGGERQDNRRDLMVIVRPRQSIRLARNRHNRTEPDVTAVRVILIKLPTAVEIARSGRSDLGLRFLAAMATLTLHEHTVASVLVERLKQSDEPHVTRRDGLQKKRVRMARGGKFCSVTRADI
jgi:ribosomal protein S7